MAFSPFMNDIEQQPRTVGLPVMTVTYELRNDMLEQMMPTAPKKEQEVEEAGPEKQEEEQVKAEEGQEELGLEETGVELAVMRQDWELVKVHCVFAGIKQRYQLAFDHYNKTDLCFNLTVEALTMRQEMGITRFSRSRF